MKMMLPDVIGHENQSQHYQHHRCLCLDLSGRITTPDRFSYHTCRPICPCSFLFAWANYTKVTDVLVKAYTKKGQGVWIAYGSQFFLIVELSASVSNGKRCESILKLADCSDEETGLWCFSEVGR